MRWALVGGILLFGCAPELPPNATPGSDGGNDASAPDGALSDGGTPDGGPDGGVADDGGPDDGGPDDGGVPDSGAPEDGGRPDDGGPPPNPFIGTWSCSGNQVETCPSGAHGDTATYTLSVSMLAGSKVESTNLDEIDTTTDTDYSAYHTVLDWDVIGDSATLDGPQFTMTFPGSTGGTWAPTYQTGSWALTAGTLTWKATGTAVYVNPDTQMCTFTQLFTCSLD